MKHPSVRLGLVEITYGKDPSEGKLFRVNFMGGNFKLNGMIFNMLMAKVIAFYDDVQKYDKAVP
jgi:hypothetical protein